MANRFSVDRVRFLAVAAALAGVASFQACTINNNNDPDDQDGGESNGGGTKNTGATANHGGSGDEGGAPTAIGGSSGTVGGAGEVEGGATGEGGATTVTGGATSEGGAGGAASCDDSVGTPTCDNVSQDCASYCAAAVANLKPAAAVAAIACLEADATCNDGYKCLADATAIGCAEDVTAACEAAITTCGEPDVGDPACDQLLSGFTDAARAEVITCMEDQSCFSVYSCAEGFFFQ